MAKKDITNESIAKLLGIHRNSVYNKLNGDSTFSIDEAIIIKNTFFPNFDVDTLFATEEKGEQEMKKLTIVDETIQLDGERIPCLKSFNIAGSAKEPGIAELTICMDVIINPELQPESTTTLDAICFIASSEFEPTF